MTEVTTYKCDCCGKEYSTKEKCLACEEGHVKFIKDSVFMFEQEEKYPQALRVTFDDGCTARYDRRLFYN